MVGPANKSLLSNYSFALPLFPLCLRKALQELCFESLRILKQVDQSQHRQEGGGQLPPSLTVVGEDRRQLGEGTDTRW